MSRQLHIGLRRDFATALIERMVDQVNDERTIAIVSVSECAKPVGTCESRFLQRCRHCSGNRTLDRCDIGSGYASVVGIGIGR